MTKVDLTKDLAHLYPTGAKARAPHMVEVPPLRYLMIDGAGDPAASKRFGEAMSALYAVSYAAKFASKEKGRDYKVMPAEGLWYADDFRVYVDGRREEWQWTLMILQPDWIDESIIAACVETAVEKGKLERSLASDLRLETLEEGTAAQVLHIGPYAAEPPVIEALHAWIGDEGYEPTGSHHEVYIGDPNRTAPEKLKTVLRQPVRRKV